MLKISIKPEKSQKIVALSDCIATQKRKGGKAQGHNGARAQKRKGFAWTFI